MTNRLVNNVASAVGRKDAIRASALRRTVFTRGSVAGPVKHGDAGRAEQGRREGLGGGGGRAGPPGGPGGGGGGGWGGRRERGRPGHDAPRRRRPARSGRGPPPRE